MLSFLGIGAQKAGTTWLYTMLSQHPDISFPSRKELHYWNRQYPAKPYTEYMKNFTHPEQCEGEITPAYGHLPVDTIRVIHSFTPQIRLIYILRNPISRAWSSALMALQRAEMKFEEASNAWFIDHFNSQGSLQRGNYEQCLRNWYSVFPREQMLLLDYEMLAEKPGNLLDQCCSHLKLRKFSMEEKKHLQLHRRVFANQKYQLNQSLRAELQRLYKNRIQSLSSYLHQDLNYWLDHTD